MGLLSWVVVGALAGWLASRFMGAARTGGAKGILVNIVVGIIGAFIGGFIVELLGGTGVNGVNVWSILVAILGSVVFIWVVRKVKK